MVGTSLYDMAAAAAGTAVADASADAIDRPPPSCAGTARSRGRIDAYAPTAVLRDVVDRSHIYCAKFCELANAVRCEGATHGLERTFACVGGRRCDVYECEESGKTTLRASFEAEDAGEELYACEWCAVEEDDDAVEQVQSGVKRRRRIAKTWKPTLAIAGEGAVVRVIDCASGALVRNLVGHGGPVNALATHPKNPTIIASASVDLSVRMWSVNTGVTIAIFAGSLGHRNGVLSLDFHSDFTSDGGVRLITGAMDNAVKVWATPPLKSTIERATKWKSNLSEFQTMVIDTPMFTSNRVHEDYVDSVGWIGDVAASKSVDGKVKLWVPDSPNGISYARGTQFRLIYQLPVENANLWWIKFGISSSRNIMACGNMRGAVVAWRLNTHRAPSVARIALTPIPTRRVKSMHADFRLDDSTPCVVRQCAVSPDGSVVVAACDNGLLCRWDAVREDGGNEDDDDVVVDDDEDDYDQDDDDDLEEDEEEDD